MCLPEQTVSGFVTAAACACPAGDSGSKEHLAPEYLHDTASGSLRRNFRVPLSCAVQERGADLCLAAVALDLTVGAAHALVAENVSAVICLDLAVCAADAAVAEDIAALVAGDLVVGVAVALVAEEVGALVGLDLSVHTADALVAEDGLAAVACLLEVAVIILFHRACPFVVYALRTVQKCVSAGADCIRFRHRCGVRLSSR